MSFFKNLFGGNKQNNKPEIDASQFKMVEKDDYTTLQDMVEQHAALSFEKQMIFADTIGNNAWELDMNQNSIRFGNLSFPIQIIGSLAFNNNSWMWGWANTKSGMPEHLLQQSHQLKAIGEQKGITELTDGHFGVEKGFEHKIGMLACGFFNANSYYCANYGQGILVVTITDNSIPKVDKNRYEKILTGFPQLISAVSLNHKNTLKNYLIDRDFKLNITDNSIEGLKDQKLITGEFDDLGRLKSLNGKI